jgi:PAS domain S-box-containing protein
MARLPFCPGRLPGSHRSLFSSFFSVLAVFLIGTLLRGLIRSFSTMRSRAKRLAESNELLAIEIEEKETIAAEFSEREERYRFLAENVSDIIFIQNVNLKIIYISWSVRVFFGYSPEEAMKLSIADLMVHDSFERAMKDFRQYRELALASENEIPLLEYVQKSGKHVWGELKVMFFYDSNSAVVGVQGIIRDITKRKYMELEHRLIEERLRQSE